MNRSNHRRNDQLRPTEIVRHCQKYPQGSALIEAGDTKVLATATIENRVPSYLKGTGQGWITAEYSMLPGSAPSRVLRDRVHPNGRSQEIQRLIGRALRSICDRTALGERTIFIDCDVIQADGSTRCSAITAAFVALVEACETIYEPGNTFPVQDFVAACSVGISSDGDQIIDLDYEEDSNAVADCNVVMSGFGEFIEVQATGEKRPLSKDEFAALLNLAQIGCDELISLQKDALGALVWRVGRVG